MSKRRFMVLGVLAGLLMFGSTAQSAEMTWQNLFPTDTGQYDTFIPDWVDMTWGKLPGPISVPVGNYTITARGTGTVTDPYRFEVSPEITIIPDGSTPDFTFSTPSQNLLEFRNWVVTHSQVRQSQVPEPSILPMLLLGLVGLAAYRKKSN